MVFDLCQQREINAQPEMAFDALGLKAGGTIREKYAASVRAPLLLFALSFLSEKEERAPQPPRRFILASVFGFQQELDAGAHVTVMLSRVVERVGAASNLFE